MTTYKRRITDTIEATRFTSDLGGIVRGVTPGTAPDGLAYSEHSGYSFHGQRVAFGDYLVGRNVIGGEEFERQWELAIVYDDSAVHVREARAAVAATTAHDATLTVSLASGSMNEAMSDVPSHVKPAKRSKRTEPSE